MVHRFQINTEVVTPTAWNNSTDWFVAARTALQGEKHGHLKESTNCQRSKMAIHRDGDLPKNNEAKCRGIGNMKDCSLRVGLTIVEAFHWPRPHPTLLMI